MSASSDPLVDAVNLWSSVNKGGVVLVFTGVLAETIAEFCRPWPKETLRRERLRRRGAWMLVIGLAIELFAGFRLEGATDEVIARLQRG